MGDTSICVPREVDLTVEVDPVLRSGSRRQQQYVGDDVSMQGHTVRSDSAQRHSEIYNQVQTEMYGIAGRSPT
jgi:hypothetical protein